MSEQMYIVNERIPEVQIHMTLAGDDFDIDAVSKSLGMIPNRSRHKYEVLGNGRKFGHTEWGVVSLRTESYDVDVVLDDFMQIFKEKYNIMPQVAADNQAEWHLVIVIRTYDGVTPSIVFSPTIIQTFADLGVNLGIDLYEYKS